VQKFIHLGLMACIFAAVLSFGGVLPLAWAGVQILAFLLCGAFIWAGFTDGIPWRGPLLLAAYVVTQPFLTHSSTVPAAALNLLTYICIFYLALPVGQNGHATSLSSLFSC
jgi:hypothetical protein